MSDIRQSQYAETSAAPVHLNQPETEFTKSEVDEPGSPIGDSSVPQVA